MAVAVAGTRRGTVAVTGPGATAVTVTMAGTGGRRNWDRGKWVDTVHRLREVGIDGLRRDGAHSLRCDGVSFLREDGVDGLRSDGV